MALDFDTYLIASSPVELQLPVRFFRRRRSNDNIDVSAAAATAAPAAVRTEELQRQFADIGIGNQHNSIGCFDDNLEDDNDNVDGFGLTKCQDRSGDVERIHQWQLSYSCDLDHCTCGSKENSRKRQHKVSFVEDDKLAEIHIVNETSDDPPILNPARRNVEESESSQPSVTLKINFDQPVSNYLQFYRKLSEINVCLENIVVDSNMQLVGTIKAKSIGFRKAVTVRCTFDSWMSFCDIEARRQQNDLSSCQYDTYEFNFWAPNSLKPVTPSPLQFAIRYHVDDQEFWDNNGGQNYTVDVVTVTADDMFKHDDTSYQQPGSMSAFAVWSDGDVGLPYW